jgi:uncharacterized membrane protein YphA (DoxX/SURF4 family)
LIWWIVLLGRLALGVVFVYAAYTKLRNPWMLFAMTVDSYQMLPEWGVELVARWLPWLELLLGVMLILGIWARWAAVGASALLVVFVCAIVRAYKMHLGINCGCFGTNEPLTKFTILRDAAFLAASGVLTVLAFKVRRRARQSA